MQNTKILEMLNNGQVEKLKTLIQKEIFLEGLKAKPDAKRRYTAMKKYFSYVKNVNTACTMPCVVDFEGEKYTSFTNGYSIALTKETSGEMELFKEPEKYLKVYKTIKYDGDAKEIDFNKIIIEAKSKGYKLKKSEIGEKGDFKYVFHYNNAYFKIGLLDATYSIINDGNKATVWHSGKYSSPMVIKNDLGVCVVLPFNYNTEKDGVTVIEVA